MTTVLATRAKGFARRRSPVFNGLPARLSAAPATAELQSVIDAILVTGLASRRPPVGAIV
jgi:hypothetical protein